MNPSITVAIIAAASSIVVALTTLVVALVSASKLRLQNEKLARAQRSHERDLAQLKAGLEAAARIDDRAYSERVILNDYREPLLRAALDLGARIHNIRRQGFFDLYLDRDPHRNSIARISTIYRFAKYWGVVELLYDKVAFSRFERDDLTREVIGALEKVGKTFASDKDERRLMMWREEQRAVAELMREPASVSGLIGYATFTLRYEQDFRPWFENFAQDVSPSARSSKRLEQLQFGLADLAERLDNAGTYQAIWKEFKEPTAPTS